MYYALGAVLLVASVLGANFLFTPDSKGEKVSTTDFFRGLAAWGVLGIAGVAAAQKTGHGPWFFLAWMVASLGVVIPACVRLERRNRRGHR